MTKQLMFILTPFISLLLNGQISDTNLISKADLRQFFSDIRYSELAKGQMLLINHPIELKIETILFYALRSQDVFQNLDTGFIAKQIQSYKYFQWDTTITINTRIVDKGIVDTLFKNAKEGSHWQTFKRLYGKEELFSLSLPIFTSDKNYCIIEINRSCGYVCGTYCVLIFKRHGKQWTRFKELECSIS